MWSVLEPTSVTVDAGATAVVRLVIRNTGDVVEEYRVDLVGDPAAWCVVQPVSLRLYPGTTGTVQLSFTPPRSPDAAAGPHPFGVRIAPVENPDATAVVEGNITVTAFVDVRAELLPPTVRGWLRGKPTLAVDNHGNTRVTAALLANATGNGVDFDVRTPSMQIQPGRAQFGKLRIKPDRLLWMGQRTPHRFTTTLQPSGAPPVSVDGTYLQSALLPRWVARLLMVLMALALVLAALWFAAKPHVSSQAVAKPATAPVGTGIPVTSPSAVPTRTAAPTTTPNSTPKATAAAHQGAPPHVTTRPIPLVPAGLWPLSSGKSSSAHDVEGRHNGVPVNAGWANGCVNFNGTSSQITTNGPVLDTGPGKSFTVLVSVYAYNNDNHFMTMVSQDGTESSGFYLQYSAANNRWAFSRVNSDTAGGTGIRALSTNAPAWQTWTRLAGVYDGATGRMQIFVNGIPEGTAVDDSPYAATGDFAIGRAKSGGNPTDWYLGALNSVEVFQQALTPAQVKAQS